MSASPGARPAGVPGTASNSPAAAPAGAVQGSAQAAAPGTPPLLAAKGELPVYPSSGGSGQSTKEENGTFAVTKHLLRSEEGPGRMKRVTAAIVVNDRMAVEGTGAAAHTVWHPRTADELHRLEGLAQAAIGFDEKRGDQVVLENVSFNSNAPEVAVTGLAKAGVEVKDLLRLQPGLLRTMMVGAIGIAVVWLVLRPVATQVVSTLKAPLLLTAQTREGSVAELEEDLDEPGLAAGSEGRQGNGLAELDSPMRDSPAKRQFAQPIPTVAVLEHLSEQIKREPAQSKRLLEAWISAGSNEGNS